MAEVPEYRLGHSWFSADKPNLQDILGRTHEQRNRPLCQCSRNEPPMYVARIGSAYFLKRMPETGHLHDPSCLSFDPPAELSGLGQVNGQAIVTDQDGETIPKLDFPLAIKGKRPPVVNDSGEEATSAVATPSKLHLLAMLHYLWEAAELTKWRRRYMGRRYWHVVQRELLAAAAKTRTKAGPLADTLFVPPTYAVEHKDRLALERRRFMQKLHPSDSKTTPLGILVAELKSQEPSQYGRKLVFKHLPDFPFFMDEATGKRFDRLASETIQMIEATPGTQLIAIATFSAKPTHGAIREIAVMPVTEHWIPFDGERELELLQALADRDFAKCLKYNLSASAPIANALLLDTDPPTALYAPASTITSDSEQDLHRIAQEGVYPAWFWPSDELEMPELP